MGLAKHFRHVGKGAFRLLVLAVPIGAVMWLGVVWPPLTYIVFTLAVVALLWAIGQL